jgi:peptidoglycan hydrolase-like protein with peptidoglycan-binding domain
MLSEDVRRLQILLTLDKDVYPEGIISGYYGSLTQKAIKRFQVKYGIVTPSDLGYGNVGPKTRAKLAEVFDKTTSIFTTLPLAATPLNVLFSVNLRFGMQSSDVYRLQQLLATDNELYPEGIVSGYFGLLTLNAAQRFQLKYNVVSSDQDTGYGLVGPKTRAKLQEIFK